MTVVSARHIIFTMVGSFIITANSTLKIAPSIIFTVVSAVHFAPYLAGLSSMMLI